MHLISELIDALHCMGLPENQISPDSRYYENIKVIEIKEIIADTILICQVFWRMKNWGMEYLHKTKGGDIRFYNSKHNLRSLRFEHNILTEKGRAIFDSAQGLTLFQHF